MSLARSVQRALCTDPLYIKTFTARITNVNSEAIGRCTQGELFLRRFPARLFHAAKKKWRLACPVDQHARDKARIWIEVPPTLFARPTISLPIEHSERLAESGRDAGATVPYEGENFANSKLDHFSLIKLLKN